MVFEKPDNHLNYINTLLLYGDHQQRPWQEVEWYQLDIMGSPQCLTWALEPVSWKADRLCSSLLSPLMRGRGLGWVSHRLAACTLGSSSVDGRVVSLGLWANFRHQLTVASGCYIQWLYWETSTLTWAMTVRTREVWWGPNLNLIGVLLLDILSMVDDQFCNRWEGRMLDRPGTVYLMP